MRAALLLLSLLCALGNAAEDAARPQEAAVVLTADNYGVIREGGTWLIEFHAPWCKHCANFKDEYDAVARALDGRIHVAKIDAARNRALSLRFGLSSYPSFFLVRGSTVWEYKGQRNKEDLMSFALGGHKSKPALPFFYSPFGVLGTAKAGMLSVGVFFTDLYRDLRTQGWPSLAAGGAVFGLGVMAVAALATISMFLWPVKPEEREHED